jgi:cell cycle protein kinase DBF2
MGTPKLSAADLAGKPSFGLQLPHPPPLLHTRSSNENWDRPSTPKQHGFTSPVQTPQGSPSKSKLPPGALNLPSVFEKAMKLAPSSPTKSGYSTPTSPGKGGLSVLEDFNESVIHKDAYQTPGSPTRRSNKENTPPTVPRLGKDLGLNANPAAISRHEPYQQRETDSARKVQTQNQVRGLTPEELEKLQLPKVKRLANVTQLCKAFPFPSLWD